MRESVRTPVPRLLHDIDGKGGAVSEQRCLAVAVERRQRVPQSCRRFRQLLDPLRVPRVDRLGGGGLRQTRRLSAEARMLRRDLQAGVRGVAVEGVEAEGVQHRLESDVRIVRQRIPQGQGAMGGQLGHQPIRERTDGFVLLRRVDLGTRRRATDGNGGSLDGAAGAGGLRCITIAALDWLKRRFVLGADEAAFDVQRPLVVDADEDACASDLRRIVADGPVLERRDGGLDLAETLIDLVGQLVGLRILLLKRVLFGLQRGEAGVIVFGEIDRLASEAAQTGGVAIGEVGGDRDPIPTLGPQRLGLGLELLDDQPIEQRRILQPAAIVMLEEVAQDHAAGGFVDIHPDELRAPVRRPDRALGELAADQIRLLVVGARYGVPDLFLASVVVGDGERHQLLQRHAVLGIDVEELVGDGG